jgi:hypothetical protein
MGAGMADYQDGNVSVDRSFARFGSKSYAIDKINSVDVKVQRKSGCLWVGLAGIAVIAVLIGMGNLSGKEPSYGSFAVAALFAGVAYVAYRGRPKPIYHLVLSTSSGEVQAFSSVDEGAIHRLRSAIEEAMTAA